MTWQANAVCLDLHQASPKPADVYVAHSAYYNLIAKAILTEQLCFHHLILIFRLTVSL